MFQHIMNIYNINCLLLYKKRFYAKFDIYVYNKACTFLIEASLYGYFPVNS